MHRGRKNPVVALAIVGTALAGCGGASGPGATSTTQPTQIVSGPISATASGPLAQAPVTNNSGAALIVGMAGASFSSVVYNPVHTLANTRIAFSQATGNAWTCNVDGSNITPLTTDMGIGSQSTESWSPDASKLAISGYVLTGYVLLEVNRTGSGEHVVPSSPSAALGVSWDPDNSQLAVGAYDSLSESFQIFSLPIAGGSGTRISDGAIAYGSPAWSPNGTKLAFSGSDGNIYTCNANGSGTTQQTYLGGFGDPAWAPDGTRLALQAYDGTHYQIGIFHLTGGVELVTHDTSSDNSNPTWSPDGRMLAFTNVSGSGAVIQTCFADGSARATIANGYYPSWSPYFARATMVGSGGAFGASAAGFLYGEVGDSVNSFVTFNGVTPSGVTVTTEQGTYGSTVVPFTISGGGGINSFKYVNGIYNSVNTIIPSGSTTSVTGIIVSMNVNDGHVALVMTYTGAVERRRHAGSTAYSGQFLGVWDKTGKNLAPAGASSVELSSKDGQPVAIKGKG